VRSVAGEDPVGIEKRPFRFLTGLLIVFVSAWWLLMTLGFSSLIDPSLREFDWWREFFHRAAGAGLFGFIVLASGVYLMWTSTTRPSPRSFQEANMVERVSVHPVYHTSGAYRVAVYRRPDGCFAFAVEARCLLPEGDEPVWTADFNDSHSGVYDSPETALREAERDIPWLKGQ
jgi:hypothetical protein